MFPASSNDRPQREDERIQPPPIAGIDGPHTLTFFDRRRILPKFPVVKRNPTITSRLPHIAPRWVGEPTARNTAFSETSFAPDFKLTHYWCSGHVRGDFSAKAQAAWRWERGSQRSWPDDRTSDLEFDQLVGGGEEGEVETCWEAGRVEES